MQKFVLIKVQGGVSMSHSEQMVWVVSGFKVHGAAKNTTGEGDLKLVCDPGWTVSSTLNDDIVVRVLNDDVVVKSPNDDIVVKHPNDDTVVKWLLTTISSLRGTSNYHPQQLQGEGKWGMCILRSEACTSRSAR